MRRIAEHHHRGLAQFQLHDRLFHRQHLYIIGKFRNHSRQILTIDDLADLLGRRIDHHRHRRTSSSSAAVTVPR